MFSGMGDEITCDLQGRRVTVVGRGVHGTMHPLATAPSQWMLATGRYEYLAGREVVGIDEYEATDHSGVRHRGGRVVPHLSATSSVVGAAAAFNCVTMGRARCTTGLK